MKREIKFSLWDNEKKQYFRDVLSLKNNAIEKWATLELRTSNDVRWLQYTGFKDKNGVEIYEGDILEYTTVMGDSRKRLDLVEFDVECSGWYGKNTANTLADILFMQHNEEWKKSQNYKTHEKQKVIIIGNIHENP